MAIGPSFYNQADQDLYAGGLQFLPQEQYRLSLGNNNQVNKLDFSNLSNSGIMSQVPAPYIYTPINQGEGGGGGPPGPDDDDDEDDDSGYTGITGYDSLGNPISNYMSPIDALKSSFAFMTNPFGYMGYKGYQAYKDKKAKKVLKELEQNIHLLKTKSGLTQLMNKKKMAKVSTLNYPCSIACCLSFGRKAWQELFMLKMR